MARDALACKLGAKTCKQTVSRQNAETWGGYCYWHRNKSLSYLRKGGDKLAELKEKFPRNVDPNKLSVALPPAEYIAAVYSEQNGMSPELNRKIARSVARMRNKKDTVPSWVAANSENRINELGSLLLSAGVKEENMAPCHLTGMHVKVFAGNVNERSAEIHLPDVEHEVIIVRELAGKHLDTDQAVILDPNIATFAPLPPENQDKSVELLIPSGKTPFGDGVYVRNAEKYINGTYLSWDSYRFKWNS